MSASLSSYTSYSSHDFVRTLRSAPDPPVDDGPSKIEIAREAWANPSFYVPSKAEVIADWILTKFLKDKGKEISQNPIFDTRYWHLLLNLLVPQDFSSSTKDAVLRPERAWLIPLLHRVPLGPIVVAFLASFHELNEVARQDLANNVDACLHVFWPTAVQKIATETLQECFGALLSTHLSGSDGEGISKIGHTICNSYRTSLTISSNKKKLYQAFLHAHFKAWIYCIQNVPDRSLRKAMLDAGVDTILNLDVLRLDLDLNGDSPLLEKLEVLLSEERDLVLKALPILFASYVDALKKNRGALFGQGSQANSGSSLNQLYDSALRSFMAFSSLMDDSSRDHQAWTVRLALLETIDRENIFSRDHTEGKLAFEQIINLALVCLDEGWKEESNYSDLAISCLSAISRIDYDLILPFIPRILPLLLLIGVPSRPYLNFLDLLLNYHIKTRTLGIFVEGLLLAISGANLTHMGYPKAYQLSFSSPLMHQIFLDRLSKALQKFLTESQSQTTISLLVASLEKLWNLLYGDAHELDAERSESPKKKRKIDTLEDLNMEQSAVAYSLVCRLACLILSSLPIHSLSEATSRTVRESITAFRVEFIFRAVSKAIKKIKKQSGLVVWSSEVALASTLRLLYALNISRNLTISPHQDEKAIKKLMDLLKLDDLLPELKLEIFRTLFYHLSYKDLIERDEVISHFLQYLKKHFSTTDIHWSGQSHHLSKGETGRAELALALLHLVVERWLPEVDRLASAEQLKTFLQILMSIEVQRGSWLDPEIDPGTLLMRLFHSAQFWEFKNIRTALLSLLDEMAVRLSSNINVDSSSISKEVHIFRHLLLFPMEYFSWPMLNDLTTCGVAADIALTSLTASNESSLVEDLTVLRIFLKRAFAYANTASQDLSSDSSDFLVHLLRPFISSAKATELIGATLELVETYTTRLLKASKKNGPKAVLDVLASIKPDAFCRPLDISALAISSLAGLLERDFPPSSLSEEIVAAVAEFLRNMRLSLTPLLETISGIDLSLQDQIQKCSDVISGWNTLLCLQRWLPQIEVPAPTLTIGRNLLLILASWLKRASTVSTQECEKLCVDVFAILLQELEMIPAVDHAQYLEIVISMYILLSSFLSDEGHRNINFHLARTCRKLAVPDYIHTLSFISDSLSNNEHLSCRHLSYLVDLATLALRDHPTHSLVHVQKFATSCLSIFNNQPIFVQGPRDVRLKVLDMISVHCANQQAALRLADTPLIWLLLSKYLAPSTIHDDETDAATFFKIVSIVGSLIRFRRDLVSHTLPHLSGILRQLISSLRACRPNLGGKQTALVIAGLPRWINAKQPLGAEEARALGRLLETLTTKTVVRVLGSAPTEAQKAESLAKPFSKHAAYVLEAYIEGMNDPLCVLSLEIRKELEAGLFALCSMMSEHSRDSLMISALDAGGKVILKALWKEYEKQRYVGKG